ncbi:calmodulin-regulated spectrin-associated protein 3-like isoform X4 [Etheostoma cragini]|uniref:calmodulin-regulated spectrin-associated protein 3-like isoform X4 n=1 Tax=Etheostoma cragini TaxID=417921 RepID=UPI00155E06E4|nr:calmodulin-regulated spectrin-associated protein 3-like isoform X4 [Etheostoma cragini]
MVDSPRAMKKTFSVPEIKPLDQYDFNRAKICANVRWLLSKSYGSAENVPVELREPFYKDQYEQEHLKPSVSKLLLSPEIYCRAQALLAQAQGVSLPAAQGSPANNSALLQFLIKKGYSPKVQDADITEEDLSFVPIKTNAHLALIDSLMTLVAKEAVGRVKMAVEAEQMGVGAPWENALLFWVNRLNQKLREITEEDEPTKSQTCTDLQTAQDSCQSNRWYWKLVPHAIAFCLKESGNKPPVIRYRKDKVQSKLTPTFPLVSAVKDLSNGCAIAAVLHYYCSNLLPLEDVCLKDTMSVTDSLYNLQLIKDFCESSLQSCCPLAVEDLLYAPPVLHLNIMSFIAELLEWFEVKKPDFVQPIQPIDLSDVSGLLDCTSPVSGNSNSGSPSFIFKQPFVPICSPVSPENKSWTKKQISRPLSAVTFSIPFGLDSDVDIVMGNPIDSVFRSVSTDSLTNGLPAMTSSVTSAGMTCVPYSPPEGLSHLVSASVPSQRSSWGPYAHTTPLGELPTIEEALQVVHTPGSKDRRKERISEKEKGGEAVLLECNEVVKKLSEALQSLQKDMQKLTEQQQQLMSNQRPKSTPQKKSTPRSTIKTPPHTPTKTPPRTPTNTSTRSTSKAWVIPGPSTTSSPSRRSHLPSSSTSPKTIVSSSCPAPRTKIHSSTPRSPKHHPRAQHQPHPRPSELKFPQLNRALAPTHNVDTLPHLRRVSPSKCQVQTSSSFRIGGQRTPPQSLQPTQQPQPDENTSDTASSETPTQFNLELEQEDMEAVGGLPVLTQPRHDRPRAAGGSSSGAPSECSFESETLSLSAAFSAIGEGRRDGGADKHCSMIEVSLSSLGGPEGGSDEPSDEGQDFSSDSMSDHAESAVEHDRVIAAQTLEPIEQLGLAMAASNLPEQQTESEREQTKETETLDPSGQQKESEARGGIGLFFQGNAHSEEEMAQRRALLFEKQQKRTEELKKRKQWNVQERENRPDKRVASPSNTPPAGTTSPSPTPPATPGRRGNFTQEEYARRNQLRIMEDLGKVLQQKSTNQGRSSAKKTRSRPRSMTREETKLSLSPAKGTNGSRLTKVYSNSSLNLAVTDEPGNRCDNPTKKPHSRPDSPSGCVTPSKLANQNGEKDLETGSNGTSPAPEYTGPKLFKEPSFKSNKFIIHNALSRCCLAGKVNESQKSKIVEEMEKSPANHFLILFRDSNCQFRGVYTMNTDSQELVRLAGVGPRTIGSTQVESIYKYSSDRKQFNAIPSKTMGMTVDAFTIPSHLWHGGGAAAGGGGGSRRASVTKKAALPK